MEKEDWLKANGLEDSVEIDFWKDHTSGLFWYSSEKCINCSNIAYKNMNAIATEKDSGSWVYHYVCPECRQKYILYKNDDMGGGCDSAFAIKEWGDHEGEISESRMRNMNVSTVGLLHDEVKNNNYKVTYR